ncbi:MAG: hypothetical protein FVQ82_08320 [Planctomycetes bacterium]|nr:hypothetical protein [Planctomycetota bacterium]
MGLPGCGKTTTVLRIVSRLSHKKLAGYYTEEIRRNNIRKGFKWNRLDGSSGILAHVEIKSRYRVSKYGVDIEGFEKSVVPVLDIEKSNAEIFVVDEIGKMECMSEQFVAAIDRLFASDKPVIATVAQKGPGIISKVKNYPEAKLFTLTRKNHDRIVEDIVQILS